ncbi:unnamed protein product [Mytilus coruscus]|uniref:VWFA domain-containing protein n=1 Tax=Mytilus coruscus TaxID=42192 RepID=A0A6J8C0N8_MYTCO|nr:unnamed protein product [Mytilus coruscus]
MKARLAATVHRSNNSPGKSTKMKCDRLGIELSGRTNAFLDSTDRECAYQKEYQKREEVQHRKLSQKAENLVVHKTFKELNKANICDVYKKGQLDPVLDDHASCERVQRSLRFGARSKEKVILWNHDNGGNPCPTDTEITQFTSWKPTIESTANKEITCWLHRNLKTSRPPSRQEIVKTEVPISIFRDLFIIIDSSGSIGCRNFEIVKEQLGELLSLFCPVPDPFYSNLHKAYNRAALIKFSNNVIEEFDFDDNHNLAELEAAIQSVSYKGGETCTGDAFYKTVQMITSSKGNIV